MLGRDGHELVVGEGWTRHIIGEAVGDLDGAGHGLDVGEVELLKLLHMAEDRAEMVAVGFELGVGKGEAREGGDLAGVGEG